MTISPKDLGIDSADTSTSFKQLIQALSGIRMLTNIKLNDVSEEQLYQHILKSILMYSDVEKCSLFLPNHDKSIFSCAASHSWDERTSYNLVRLRSKPTEFKPGEGILGKVVSTRKPYHCKNLEDDENFLRIKGKEYRGSLICCPILDGENIIAILNLRHPYPNHFHLWQENICQTYSHIIARLISNYRLIHQMEEQVNLQTQHLEKALTESEEMKRRYQELSSIDYLTQCYNRRYFFPKYETMIASAARHKDELSVLIIDLDYFKRLNDNYGHEFGDKVLVEVSNILKKQIRKDDLLARMGGEEFALALHRTDLDGCMIFAERLRATVAALDWNEQGEKVSTTVSIGVSSLTLHDYSESGLSTILLKEADQALYACKENGRNQCQCYSTEMAIHRKTPVISMAEEKNKFAK